ncbi:MAG: type I restriction-modification enzyme R subunit C-terminal domain-containing protein [Candidatus Pacebacteria bacterium]|nr:type I restriction-modification enzyme R subunit C-terminal domain-containing protein [Candidatus Paceibacterota bacterium]
MTPEEEARGVIDGLLEAAGWKVQDYRKINLGASLGVAVREFPLKTGSADYLLFVDRKAAGVIEAKPVGATLGGVDWQSGKYSVGLPDNLPHYQKPLPFVYESTGKETLFRDLRDPEPCSRRVFTFFKPETLQEQILQDKTLRAKLKELPPLITEGLRNCQIEAVTNLEDSFSDARPRALIQMASGGGKTFTAVTTAYRLVKFAKARRILFLVDRNHLGRQTLKEFQQYITPDDRRKFTELYNVQRLTSNQIDPVCKVVITTIQRVYSMLKGEELDPEIEEHSTFELSAAYPEPRQVEYNPQIPIETFDFIVTDECHRSIYNLWRQVLEYFDAFLIGLTATPSKQTLGFFNQNLVTEYSHDRAMADGVNVGYEVYIIRTKITKQGSTVEAGNYIDKRDKLTREIRWEQLDDDLQYANDELDRSVVAKDQIRTIIKTFKEKLFTEIFPGRKDVPKTLIYAKDDSHAEDILHIIREEFAKGNDFAKKITYKTTGEDPEDLIASFRNSYNPRIAVTVDMVATGTDIKPLECIIFMRDIRSRTYFEQMKGRGTRVINSTDFNAVTPDAQNKTHFVIVDAVGVCESDKTDSRPLERCKTTPFDKLLLGIALGKRDKDTISSLADRLARIDRTLEPEEDKQITKLSGGQNLKQIINGLLDAIDPDKQSQKAKDTFNTDTPTEEQLQKAAERLTATACQPFDSPDFRNTLIEIKRKNEQIIDTVSKDEVVAAGFNEQAKQKAKGVIDSFKKFIEDNKDQILALQILYNIPFGKKHVTYEQIKALTEVLAKPPYGLTQQLIWTAYEQLEKSKVKKARPDKLLTDIISLVRFAIGKDVYLEPFSDIEDQKFAQWLEQQQKQGKQFTAQQLGWLTMIKDHITTSLKIEKDDFEYTPFAEKGGQVKAQQVFGNQLDKILSELNEVLAA